MKKCTICNDDKELSEFNKNSNKKDGYNTICRSCSNEYSKKYYKINSIKMVRQINEKSKERILEHRKKIFDYFKKHPCVDCDERDPLVLEFDHVRGKKSVDVSKLVSNGYSWKKIEKEIKKCDVRCANCHRRKTAKQLKFYQGLIEF